MTRLDKLKLITKWGWVGISVWVFVFLYAAWPVEKYFVLKSVKVSNTYVSLVNADARVLFVEREIRRPFLGTYRVEERRKDGEGWTTVGACTSEGKIPYRVDAELPKPYVTAAYWKWGDCGAIFTFPAVEGSTLKLCTIHYVYPFQMMPWIFKPNKEVCSNEYTGRIIVQSNNPATNQL